MPITYKTGGTRSTTFVVAANNATAKERSGADYVCDGTADEVQINAALAALPASYGGVVQLTPGLYYIAAPIVANIAGATLRGSSWRLGAYLIPTAGANPSSMISIGSAADVSMVTLENLSLDASIGANTSTGKGISIYGGYCIVRDVMVQGFADIGIYINTRGTAYNNLLDNVYVLYSGASGTPKAGILVNANVYDTMMSGVLVQGGVDVDHETTEYGIYLTGDGNVLRACHAWMCGVAGLGLNGADDTQVLGGQFENNKAANGIVIVGGDNIIITGVEMFLNTGGDMVISGTPTSLEISHCHLRSACTNNIYAANGTRMKIVDCDFDSSTNAPVNVTCTYSIIHDCTFQDGDAASLYVGGTNNLVHHNKLTKGIGEAVGADYNDFDANILDSGALTTAGNNSRLRPW